MKANGKRYDELGPGHRTVFSEGQEPIFMKNTLPLYFLSRTSLFFEVVHCEEYTLEYLLLIQYYARRFSLICSRKMRLEQ
jgi:hypothetical protein